MQSQPRRATRSTLETSLALAKQRGRRSLLRRRADDTAGNIVLPTQGGRLGNETRDPPPPIHTH